MALELITLDEARIHCKADGEDDDILLLYAEAAEKDAEVSLNRAVFKDQASMDAAIAAIPAAMVSARQARDAALAAAQEIENYEDRCDAVKYAISVYDDKRRGFSNTYNAVLIDAHIRGAILLTVGHSYQNRSSVVTGQGAAAVEVPSTAREIYEKRRYLGPWQ